MRAWTLIGIVLGALTGAALLGLPSSDASINPPTVLTLAPSGQEIAVAPSGQEIAVAREIARLAGELRSAGRITLSGIAVPRTSVLLQLYERREFRPLWSDLSRAAALLASVRAARLDGLVPQDYHLTVLDEDPRTWTARELAERDVLSTDALIRLTHDLRFGKLEPAGPGTGRDLSRPLRSEDAVADLEALLSAPRLDEEIRALRSNHFVYMGLVRALAGLREIEEAGGWDPIPPGPALMLDSIDARVPLLRDRLALEGDLPPFDVGSWPRFDAALERAVRVFQHRHGLNEDGIVGNATLRELNVPVGRRIDQVRLNLERARWITRGLPETFVVVNIAGAKVYLVREGSVVFETRAVVGAAYTRTPVFRATMKHVELNPTWTVPPSIVDEVLAAMRRDPRYLAKQGFRVLDRSGREVDPSVINPARATAAGGAWTFRQDPGPLNPLGGIKFVFPNPYNVYLHDTSRPDLFTREERFFSHGCIRVQHPLALAELLLGDPTRWNRDSLEAAIAAGRTVAVPLPQPVEVLIQYWTAAVDERGVLHFYRDVYRRDAALLAALDAP